jgi:hypothetical protein
VLAFAWLLSAAAASHAQDDATRATARQLGVEGIDAYHANDFATAERKLDRAYQLIATPTLGLWSARARLKAGHWVEAAERLRETVRGSPDVGDVSAQRQALQDAALELETLLPRLPVLTIELDHAQAAEVLLKLDGSMVPSSMVGLARPTNPGSHQLVATRGAARTQTDFQLVEGERRTLQLQLAQIDAPAVVEARPTPSEAAGTSAPVKNSAREAAAVSAGDNSVPLLKPVAIVALSLGGVGLATSAVTALTSTSKTDNCTDAGSVWHCNTKDQASAYNSVRTISTVTFYLGAAFAVGGFTAWLLASSSRSEPANDLTWSAGPGNVSLRGHF